MHRINTLIICLILFFSFAGIILSQGGVPNQIKYSGTLTDKNDNLVNGHRTLRFRIYDSFTGGSQLWTDTYQDVEVINGAFTIILGINIALPADLPKNSYLQIEVKNGVDYEIMVPRLRITGSIYSISSDIQDGADICPSDMVWTGTFCVDKNKSYDKTVFTDAIRRCTLKGKRLCTAWELILTCYYRDEWGISDYCVSPNYTDYEFAADKCEKAKTIVPSIYVVDYNIVGFDCRFFHAVRVENKYISPDFPETHPESICYENSVDDPEWCWVIAHFRCCK